MVSREAISKLLNKFFQHRPSRSVLVKQHILHEEDYYHEPALCKVSAKGKVGKKEKSTKGVKKDGAKGGGGENEAGGKGAKRDGAAKTESNNAHKKKEKEKLAKVSKKDKKQSKVDPPVTMQHGSIMIMFDQVVPPPYGGANYSRTNSQSKLNKEDVNGNNSATNNSNNSATNNSNNTNHVAMHKSNSVIHIVKNRSNSNGSDNKGMNRTRSSSSNSTSTNHVTSNIANTNIRANTSVNPITTSNNINISATNTNSDSPNNKTSSKTNSTRNINIPSNTNRDGASNRTRNNINADSTPNEEDTSDEGGEVKVSSPLMGQNGIWRNASTGAIVSPVPLVRAGAPPPSFNLRTSSELPKVAHHIPTPYFDLMLSTVDWTEES